MKKDRVDILDVIKGIMILFIIITHFHFIYPEDYQRYGFFFYIDMAVPVFMIVSGYLAVVKFESAEFSLRTYFAYENIVTKYCRFLVPALCVFLIEVPILIVFLNYRIEDMIKTLVRGGYGPGSYYTPIMLQFLIVVPIIYLLIKQFDFFGTIICFVLTGLWEMLQYSWDFSDLSYKICIFRYISVIGWGCYIAIGRGVLKKYLLIVMFIIGFIWQFLLNYIPLSPSFMNCTWARVNYLPSLMVMPITYWIIRKYNRIKYKGVVLTKLGRASYDVFLVQMVFYGCGPSKILYRFVDARWLQLLICLTVCSVCGLFFYQIEQRLTKYIVSVLKKKQYYKKWIANRVDDINCKVVKG